MIIGALLAVSAAWKLRRLDDRAFDRLVAGLGIFLAVTEIFKQICLFRAAGGHYDWWYFPFQLCSMPMYMCLACTFSHSGRVRRLLCTFMHNFSLLGALAVIFDTSGLYHESLLLTAHSFLWHILIIFLGALIGFSGRMDVSWKGYRDSALLFLALCAAATGINVWAHPFGDINMFYITPYSPSNQVVFRGIARCLGTIPTDLIYVGCIASGAAAMHAGERRYVGKAE